MILDYCPLDQHMHYGTSDLLKNLAGRPLQYSECQPKIFSAADGQPDDVADASKAAAPLVSRKELVEKIVQLDDAAVASHQEQWLPDAAGEGHKDETDATNEEAADQEAVDEEAVLTKMRDDVKSLRKLIGKTLRNMRRERKTRRERKARRVHRDEPVPKDKKEKERSPPGLTWE